MPLINESKPPVLVLSPVRISISRCLGTGGLKLGDFGDADLTSPDLFRRRLCSEPGFEIATSSAWDWPFSGTKFCLIV